MRRLTPHWPMIACSGPERDGCGLARFCWELVSCLAGMWGGWTCATAQNRLDRLTFEVGVYFDLSYLASGPKEPLGLGPVACHALESHL